MRGIATAVNPISTTSSPVGIFIGDTAFNEPYAAGVTPDLSAFDLKDIEVLKGPQGTLFGGAALAGAIRYRLNDPDPYVLQFRGFSQLTSLTKGSVAFTEGVAANLPVSMGSGALGLRAAYIRRNYPGVYDNTRPEDAAIDVDRGDGEQFRLGVLWVPDAPLQLKFTFLSQNYSADNALIVSDNRNGPRATSFSLLPWPNKHNFRLYNLEFDYNFDDMKLVSSSSRTEKTRHYLLDSLGLLIGTPPEGTPDSLAIPFVTNQKSASFAQELRLQSKDSDGLEWLLGGYFYRAAPLDYDLEVSVQALHDVGQLTANVGDLLTALKSSFDAIAGPGNLVSSLLGAASTTGDVLKCELSLLCAQTHAKARELALFADFTDTFWDRLELSAGARLYQTDVAGGFTGQGLGVRLVNKGVSPADLRDRRTERGVNPKLSATYRFTKSISLYAQAARGFRFGGIQNIPPSKAENIPATFKSDTLWNYEIGLRTEWFHNTLRLDVTGFHIDYKNPQVSLASPALVGYYDNIDSARSDGMEGNLQWLTPIPGVALSITGGVTNARTTSDFMAGNTLVPSGAALPGSAKKQYSGQLSYFWPYGGPLSFGAAFTYAYIGKTEAALPHSDYVYDFGTMGVNLQLGAPDWPGKPTLVLGVDNLKDVAAPIGFLKSNTGELFYIMNPPRTFVARLNFEFE